jgi:hypothetical protein
VPEHLLHQENIVCDQHILFFTKTESFRFHLKEKWALRGKDCCCPKMS